MSDKTQKFLAKLPTKELGKALSIIAQVRAGKLEGLGAKHLKGHPGYFRIRAGRMRIVFRRSGTDYEIIQVSYRDDQTYRDL